MSIITPKETIQKTYRLELTQAEDLEYLAKAVGRTQNELIVASVRELLYQNRSYYLEQVLKTELLPYLTKELCILGNEVFIEKANLMLNITKKEEEDEESTLFLYEFCARNKRNRVVLTQTGEIDIMQKKQWSQFMTDLVTWISTYADLDNDESALYFKNYFLSRS